MLQASLQPLDRHHFSMAVLTLCFSGYLKEYNDAQPDMEIVLALALAP